MEVREGYKQTEVGVIPSDWGLRSIEEISVINGLVRGPFGGALKKEVFVPKGYKVYEQRNAIYGDVSLGNYYIDNSKFNELRRFEVNECDFIISCSGTIGKIFQIPKKYEKGVINQALLKITTNRNLFSDQYFCQYFKWTKFQQRIIDNTQGGAMKNLIGMAEFKTTLLPLPPTKAEQTAIATVLSDADALIQSLTTLIAKKRNIKRGAMQELLKPKEGWVVKKLGEIFDISSGNGSLVKTIENGKYFIIEMGSISENGELLLNKQSNTRQNLLIEGDLVMPTRDIGEGKIIGKVAYLDKNDAYILSNNVYRMTLRNDLYDAHFFYFLINSEAINRKLKRKVAKSVQLALNKKYVEHQQVYFPFSKLEQTRIATILSDMEAAINALETKLQKYKQIKQGMMQELLTGKTRLI